MQEKTHADQQARLLRYSNLGPLAGCTFANLAPSRRNRGAVGSERFRRCLAAARAYAEEPCGWLVITGPSGCGKTHLAAAIANRRLEKGEPALFVVVPDLLDHLRAAFSPQSDTPYDQLFEQVRSAPVLVLDDLGAQSSTPWAQEKLFQLINHRHSARLPTVITTSMQLEQLDERLRTRIADGTLSEVLEVEEQAELALRGEGPLSLPLLAGMTFDTFDCRGSKASAVQQQKLREAYSIARKFAQSPEDWLVLLGPYGCGKTHLAAAIANHRLRAGHPVLFIVVPDLLDHLRATYAPESRVAYDELFERVRAAPLLILDDFGMHAASPWAQEKLYQILNYRYNARLPTVITSVYSLEEIDPRFAGRMADPRAATAIYIDAPDYRGGPPRTRAGGQDTRPGRRPASGPRA